MSIYAVWNNKGGVGKSYLTFQVAAEYARVHPERRVLVVDLCPQANASSMLLGGIIAGEDHLNRIHSTHPRLTIAGYVEDRILSPYVNPKSGSRYALKVCDFNSRIPTNLYLVVGDEQLEIQSSRVGAAASPGPQDAWRIVHTWVSDLISDVTESWGVEESTVFIDCNPSFSIYTELALAASDRLIVPFSADGSSKRAVRAVLALVYGVTRQPGQQQSEFFLNSQRFRMSVPSLYMYVGNRLTQSSQASAAAFKSVVNEIAEEIFAVWQKNPNLFAIHPGGAPIPVGKKAFRSMFQYEVNDANTASVVSQTCGIPIARLTAGARDVLGKSVMVNQSQLDKQVPNIRDLAAAIE